MTLSNPRQLETTRQKLELLEQQIAAMREEPGSDPHARELTLRSLKRLANQLKEEIARCEAMHLSADSSPAS